MSSLRDRRMSKIDKFLQKTLKHERHKNMFPISEKFTKNTHNLRYPEKFEVNKAKTQAYSKSFIPFAQRRLNELRKTGKI